MRNRWKSLCGFWKTVLILVIIGPITMSLCGCESQKNQVNVLTKRDYLPDFYSSSFVFSDSGSKRYAREPWPASPEARRAVKSEKSKTYTRSHYSSHINSRGRLHQNFSYRTVTNSVK